MCRRFSFGRNKRLLKRFEVFAPSQVRVRESEDVSTKRRASRSSALSLNIIRLLVWSARQDTLYLNLLQIARVAPAGISFWLRAPSSGGKWFAQKARSDPQLLEFHCAGRLSRRELQNNFQQSPCRSIKIATSLSHTLPALLVIWDLRRWLRNRFGEICSLFYVGLP